MSLSRVLPSFVEKKSAGVPLQSLAVVTVMLLSRACSVVSYSL